MEFKTTEVENHARPFVEKDIRSVITLLAVQCMIHLGEIPDPISHQSQLNVPSADLFLGLIEILKEKTQGNLSSTEQAFLQDTLENLKKIRKKKG